MKEKKESVWRRALSPLFRLGNALLGVQTSAPCCHRDHPNEHLSAKQMDQDRVVAFEKGGAVQEAKPLKSPEEMFVDMQDQRYVEGAVLSSKSYVHVHETDLRLTLQAVERELLQPGIHPDHRERLWKERARLWEMLKGFAPKT